MKLYSLKHGVALSCIYMKDEKEINLTKFGDIIFVAKLSRLNKVYRFLQKHEGLRKFINSSNIFTSIIWICIMLAAMMENFFPVPSINSYLQAIADKIEYLLILNVFGIYFFIGFIAVLFFGPFSIINELENETPDELHWHGDHFTALYSDCSVSHNFYLNLFIRGMAVYDRKNGWLSLNMVNYIEPSVFNDMVELHNLVVNGRAMQ